MTTPLLSQHSSNPLEVSSSDIRNKNLLKQYIQAQAARRGDDSMLSSDDPLAVRGEAEAYRTRRCLSKERTGRGGVVDEDMESDDELMRDEEEEDVVVHDEGDEEADGEHEDDDDNNHDDQSSNDDDDDEESSLLLKPSSERDEILSEISDLQSSVPSLSPNYKIIDRLGTGTFSSVYKALDLHYHSKWDNTPWHGHHPSSSSAYYQSVKAREGSKVYVAVKRIYVTSNPERIRNEVAIMEDCRGCRHVSQLITAFRHEDQVVAIMPYHRNVDFREIFRVLPMPGIKAYFRCMFRALRDVHARGMIHRDVKPANFLFDPRTGIGTLCDFGLACRIEPGQTQGACLHTPASREFPHGRLRHRGDYDVEQIKKMQREARIKSSWLSEKVGYPDKDTRPHSKANRAGTRGFRAPEVLLKCNEQTGAIDVWSAGMILLFFLTGKFPLFQSGDDVEGLMEIATIIGRKKMEKTATLHSRTFATNVPSISQDGMPWREFVQNQNEELMEPRTPNPRFYPYNTVPPQPETNSHLPPPSSSSGHERSSHSPSPSITLAPPTPESHAQDIDSAFDLLDGLMHPESTRRITPRDALYHPFLADPSEPEDDEFFPHPFGEGVCGDWHHLDEVTEEACVRVNVGVDGDGVGGGEVRRVMAGEGIAIGRWPCEFHRKEYACEE